MTHRRRQPAFGVLVLTVLSAVAALLFGWTRTERPDQTDAVADRTRFHEIVSDYLAGIPRAGSGGYTTPSPQEVEAVAAAWKKIASGDTRTAARLIEPFGYSLEARGRTAIIEGPGGLFVHRSGAADLVIEAPHPLADWATEEVAADLFSQTSAAVLLVAGAHRSAGAGDSADVAHREDTVFHALHMAASESRVTVQVHGFADTTAPGFDVVLSNGGPPSALTALVNAAMQKSFESCLWTPATTGACAALSARSNAQARHARRTNREFIHVELSRSVREAPGARREAIALLASALRPDKGG